jgi:hypothetical protein
MSGNDGKIIVDADNGKLDAANKRSQEAFKKTAGEAAKVGTQIDKWGRQLAEKVAGLGAIIGVMRSIGQEVERQRSQAAGANKSVGGSALGRSQAIRDLGLDSIQSGAGGVDAVINGGAGGTSVSDRDAFVAGLAAASKSGKSKISPGNAMQALSLFNSGVFSQDELIDAAAKGGDALSGLRGQQSSRFNALSPAAREELAFREQERTISSTVNDLSAGAGRGARIASSQDDLLTAQNPFLGGFRNVIRNNSGGVLDLLESSAVVGDSGSAMLRQQNEILSRIAENTKEVPRPNLRTTPEGGP